MVVRHLIEGSTAATSVPVALVRLVRPGAGAAGDGVGNRSGPVHAATHVAPHLAGRPEVQTSGLRKVTTQLKVLARRPAVAPPVRLAAGLALRREQVGPLEGASRPARAVIGPPDLGRPGQLPGAVRAGVAIKVPLTFLRTGPPVSDRGRLAVAP